MFVQSSKSHVVQGYCLCVVKSENVSLLPEENNIKIIYSIVLCNKVTMHGSENISKCHICMYISGVASCLPKINTWQLI